MGNTVPIRSERSEQRLSRQLGEEVRMAVSIETRLQGMAAVRFVDRLDDTSRISRCQTVMDGKGDDGLSCRFCDREFSSTISKRFETTLFG